MVPDAAAVAGPAAARRLRVTERRGPVRAFVGLGSNLDDPAAQVAAALQALAGLERTRLVSRSRRFRNPPMGPADQPDYVNAVAELETELPPHVLLDGQQGVE